MIKINYFLLRKILELGISIKDITKNELKIIGEYKNDKKSVKEDYEFNL